MSVIAGYHAESYDYVGHFRNQSRNFGFGFRLRPLVWSPERKHQSRTILPQNNRGARLAWAEAGAEAVDSKRAYVDDDTLINIAGWFCVGSTGCVCVCASSALLSSLRPGRYLVLKLSIPVDHHREVVQRRFAVCFNQPPYWIRIEWGKQTVAIIWIKTEWRTRIRVRSTLQCLALIQSHISTLVRMISLVVQIKMKCFCVFLCLICGLAGCRICKRSHALLRTFLYLWVFCCGSSS